MSPARPAVVAAYEAALPDDPRVERKKMFGMPCAFVNRQMFFGTFEGTYRGLGVVVVFLGSAAVAALGGDFKVDSGHTEWVDGRAHHVRWCRCLRSTTG